MAVSVTCQSVVQQNAKWYVTFEDGVQLEFATLLEMQRAGSDLDNPASDVSYMLFLRWWLARSPAATNTNLITGKTFTFDLSAVQPIKVQ